MPRLCAEIFVAVERIAVMRYLVWNSEQPVDVSERSAGEIIRIEIRGEAVGVRDVRAEYDALDVEAVVQALIRLHRVLDDDVAMDFVVFPRR